MSQFHEAMEIIGAYCAHAGEVQLLDFGESSAIGAYVKMRLPDPDELSVFRGRERHTKSKAGQRYIMMLVEVQDDESVVEPARVRDPNATMSASNTAFMLCRDPAFQSYASHRWGVEESEHGAAQAIKGACEITTRKQLDTSSEAARMFASLMRDYGEHKRAVA